MNIDTKNKGKFYNSSNDIISGNLKKSIKKGFFIIEITFLLMTQILHMPKIIFVVSHALKLYFLFFIIQIFISFEVIIFPIKSCR